MTREMMMPAMDDKVVGADPSIPLATSLSPYAVLVSGWKRARWLTDSLEERELRISTEQRSR
jgi:hypothetical protein